ncbi:MAG: hypothetical protein ABJN42_19855 [Roseibium sp.]|uniref:hypothetical protein n=1 Tax=Roseibium sp. TaxID=1936156 RepID=UPI0032968194
MHSSLLSAGFTREERRTTIILNEMPDMIRLRDDVFPALLEDLMETKLLGRVFTVPAGQGRADPCDISFYFEGGDILIRMARPDETYGLTLFWRGEPALFLYSDLSQEDWKGTPRSQIEAFMPYMRAFCDLFLEQRAGEAGKTLSFEGDFFNGMPRPA